MTMLVLVSCFFCDVPTAVRTCYQCAYRYTVPGIYCQHMCTLDTGSLAEPFSSILLDFCDLDSFLAFGSASAFIRIIIYRHLTWNQCGIFLAVEQGLPVRNYWVVLPVHFVSVKLLGPHRTQQARKQGPAVFQVKLYRGVASIQLKFHPLDR